MDSHLFAETCPDISRGKDKRRDGRVQVTEGWMEQEGKAWWGRT